ncbi:MauE/DoxX family redox-associated membrane protein [Aquimarina sp. RZ0]|uniref:heavy metal translocating P-type ATPase n=1 Tax=Aquimarina sp. RZ0 TaxID=2607730 RepID=UPI0011F1DB18|nr:MauE/DoxX family redox-associated membrane protein [Aquimarina sp. RZ0]KAA1242399.1 heavy metal transporter [Aquimarina sp. RZ0]
MKQLYKIEGMTCNGCRNTVESALKSIPEIRTVEVDLESSNAIIDSENYLNSSFLQEKIPNKYTIAEIKEDKSTAPKLITHQINEWKQLFPLFLILGYITTAAILMNYDPWEIRGFMLDFMGLFYIVFSFFKMLDLRGFPSSFGMYDPLAKVLPVYGWIYPFIETILGLMFLMRFRIEIGLIITIVLLGITTIGVTKTLVDKKSIQCACLGTALKLPMTKATFVENSIMLVMAFIMLLHTFD